LGHDVDMTIHLFKLYPFDQLFGFRKQVGHVVQLL